MPQTSQVTPFLRRLPHPALIFVVIAWGLNFSVIKIAYLEMSPQAVGLLRYLTMLPILVLWCVLAKQSLTYPKGMFLRLNLAGFVGSGAYMVMFLEGMRTAPAALGSMALSTVPIMTTVLSVLFKQERFTWRLLIGSVVAFGGVTLGILAMGSKSQGSVTGALLVLVSALLWAFSVIMYRKLLADMSAVRVLTLSFPGALLIMLPYGYSAVSTLDWGKVSSTGWLAMAYLVLIAGVGAFAAYYKGLADVGPARTSMTQYFVPPVAAIFASFLIKEKLVVMEVVALLVVIAGVATAVWNAPKPIDEKSRAEAPMAPESSSA